MRARRGSQPKSMRVILPMRAAPAVCEELGPIITGPMTSNKSMLAPLSMVLLGLS